MVALGLLLLSSTVLSIDATSSSQTDALSIENTSSLGIAAILTASIMSGLAGTLTQKALQSEASPRNTLVFSCELAVYGIAFTFLRVFIENGLHILDGDLIAKQGFLSNLEMTVLIPITVNAIGGIGVGFITKTLSVVHKSYAMIFGILLSGLIRSRLYSTPMSNAMYVALPLVMISLWLNIETKP